MKYIKRLIIALTVIICISLINGCSTNKGAKPEQLDDLAALSDEFDDTSTLEQWLTATDVSNIRNEEKFITSMDINQTSEGSLYIVPAAGSWYSRNTGHLSYKKIKGDFTVTMRVKVTGKTSPIPTGAFDLAGLMARSPSLVDGEVVPPTKENWEYHSTGGEGNKRILDFKTTVNSSSSFRIKEVNSEWIILRMSRVGTKIVKLYKEDDQGEWQLASMNDRPDLPEELQVGVCVLTNLNGEPDHTIAIDYIRFNRPALSKDMQEKAAQKTATEEDWKAALMDS